MEQGGIYDAWHKRTPDFISLHLVRGGKVYVKKKMRVSEQTEKRQNVQAQRHENYLHGYQTPTQYKKV